EVVDTMPHSCHPAIFLVNDTGSVTRQADIEKTVLVIRQERDEELRRIAAEQHARTTVQSQEKLFDALAAQGVTEIEIRFSIHCTSSSFEDSEASLEILNMKPDEVIVADEQG